MAFRLALHGVVLALVLLLPHALPGQGKDPKKKDDAKSEKKADAKRSAERTRQYMKQLHARFKAWDKDNDNKLDAGELANVFRGPKAQPLDKMKIHLPMPSHVAPPAIYVESVPGKVSSVSLVLLTWPEPCLVGNSVVAGLLSMPPREVTKIIPSPLPKPTPPPKIPDFTRFGDYQFLAIVNKGKGWSVTKAEFEAFAKHYANVLDEMEEAEHDVAQAKMHLAKADKAKGKAQAQQELQRAQVVLNRTRAQWLAIPEAIHRELKIKH